MEYERLMRQYTEDFPSIEELERRELMKAAGEEGDEWDAFRALFLG